jgi:TetR/AcrR family transcriptional regulator, mexCD-oprJ operon repressor
MASTTDQPTGRQDHRDAAASRDAAAPWRPAERRRADAERSIAAIIDAGLACFAADPDVSMTAIARAAGVGRVTLYTHFPSREALLEAVLAHALAQANASLDDEPLDQGSARDALAELIRSSWQLLDHHRRLMAAALHLLGPAPLRQHHDLAMARVERLITRGQDEGTFRTDLPRGWLVATFYSLLHTAAEEVNAGRLAPATAADTLEATLLAAFAAQADRESRTSSHR